MLTDDASFAMPPRPSWYQGRAAIGLFLAAQPLSGPHRWRLAPVGANAQPAFGTYLGTRARRPVALHSIEVLTLDDSARLSAITAFHAPEAFARFGLPLALPS